MNTQDLEKKYDTMVTELNTLTVILHDAESAMVEEVSAEGFASKATRDKVAKIKAELDDVDFDLYCFKQDNAAFVSALKDARKKAREAQNERAFEAFWNN